MSGEEVDFGQATDAVAEGSSRTKDARERSTIDFPYMPLEAAFEIANAIYSRCGFGSCDQDELAAEMGQTLSGAFRQKTSAARTFGLAGKDGRSAFILTDLGKRIVSSETEKAARVDAFLTVPLYNAIYEKFRGHNLPPAKALEREMEALGVSHKQTDRARQAFERSAQYAGFFDSGKERLVRPRMDGNGGHIEQGPLLNTDPKPEREQKYCGGSGSGDGDLPPPGVDPIIRGLIDRLPAAGAKWPKTKRKLWLQILENSFDLVYDDDVAKRDDSDLI